MFVVARVLRKGRLRPQDLLCSCTLNLCLEQLFAFERSRCACPQGGGNMDDRTIGPGVIWIIGLLLVLVDGCLGPFPCHLAPMAMASMKFKPGPQAGGPAKGRWGEAGGGQGPYRHPKNPTAAIPPSKESHRHRTPIYRRTATATQSRQKYSVFEHLRYITFLRNQPTS